MLLFVAAISENHRVYESCGRVHQYKVECKLSPTVSWTQLMKGGAHPSPFAALAFPNSKKVPIFCWVDRESFPVTVQTKIRRHIMWRLIRVYIV